MYRLALASLLALTLMDVVTACPPAQSRITIVDGKEVVEWFCAPGKVMFMHENVYRCFDRCDHCPNGACVENECKCFPGTEEEAPGVCGKICPNCENGWCSSTTKCECFDGFEMVSGKCVPSKNPAKIQTNPFKCKQTSPQRPSSTQGRGLKFRAGVEFQNLELVPQTYTPSVDNNIP